jgi:1-aminocyclopropane-1-carboxylate deaminase
MVTIPEFTPRIQPLSAEWFSPYVVEVDMLRLDELHPEVSGNKWYKLKYNLQQAVEAGFDTVLTFGGGYSNHLTATAAAAKLIGLRSIGIVRGRYEPLTPTLEGCVTNSMELVFVPREEYGCKEDEQWLAELRAKYSAFIIPEGGANEWGRKGAEEIASMVPLDYTHVCVSVGTGTTFIGLRNALPAGQALWGYVPMKRGGYLKDEITSQLSTDANWQLFDEWHFGGFGKVNDTLIDFMNQFYAIHRTPLDIVYTAKMMYGIRQQMQQSVFPKEAKLLCIHTGGLQGNASVAGRLAY